MRRWGRAWIWGLLGLVLLGVAVALYVGAGGWEEDGVPPQVGPAPSASSAAVDGASRESAASPELVTSVGSSAGDATSAVRIARGGSWNVGDAALFRTARLGGFGPDYRCGFLGIRCVVEPEPEHDAQ